MRLPEGGNSPNEPPGMLRLRLNFEGREAIYLEKGALRVRVSDIRASPRGTTVSAEIEEIPAPGLGVGLFDSSQRKGTPPLRWTIRAGHLTEFSDRCWIMGYGGWSMYFEPKIVQGVLDLASRFPDNLDAFERYNRIVQFVQYDQPFFPENWQAVFPAP